MLPQFLRAFNFLLVSDGDGARAGSTLWMFYPYYLIFSANSALLLHNSKRFVFLD
jgi:hypothetical protein